LISLGEKQPVEPPVASVGGKCREVVDRVPGICESDTLMVNLKIDGKTAQVPKGATILDAATAVGVRIPTLCFLQKVSPTGACRICVVEIEGVEKPMTACNTPAVEGISVITQSERLAVIRRQVVELLLVNHPLDCPVCDAGGECDLQDTCYAHDVTRQPFAAEDVNHDVIDEWPLIQQVPSRCILCEKCVKVCFEVVGSGSLWINDRGDRAFIDKKLELCEFCGNCVQVCPTGTMISKPFKFKARPWELRQTPSVCTLCAAQCQINVQTKRDRICRVTSEDGATVNDGNLCIGGFFGYEFVHSDRRLVQPAVRTSGGSQPVTWEEALQTVAGKIKDLRSGPGGGAIAALGSPRFTNEENYLFQKLFRVGIGTNQLDSEARFGSLRALQVLNDNLGLQGASNHLKKIGHADAVLVFGSDVTAEAPAIDWQIEQACRKRDGKLVIANLRRVKLSRYAEAFLQYCPGSESALANALARIILDRGLADQAFLDRSVKNVDELKTHLGAIDLAEAVRATGVSLELLNEAAEYLGRAGSVAIVFGADLTRSAGAEDAIAAVANLALVAGALHGDAGGLFPVDEKGNMQGLLDMGVCPERLPGYQSYEASRGRFEKAWNCTLPETGGDALAILEGIEKGEIRLLYLAGANPLVGFPDSGRWRRALEKVEFLVVQDILSSELTDLAHVVLPGATSFEKQGSVTSLDHRVNKLGRALEPVGEARQDWTILAELYGMVSPSGIQPSWKQIEEEIRQLVPLYGASCFLEGGSGQSCLKEPFRIEGKTLLYAPVEGAEADAGLKLLVGKILPHFGTTTVASPANLEIAPTGWIGMHPEDAAACGVGEGAMIRVKSASGTSQGAVKISPDLQPGLLFAPYHFADVNPNQVISSGSNMAVVQVEKI